MKKISRMALILAFILPACAPGSMLTHTWKAQGVSPVSYKKIVVVGLLRDRGFREKMEQHLAEDLRALGYNATCSCDQYDPKTFEGMSEEQATDKLKKEGVDAVLTIVMLDKQKERYYVPSRVYYSPFYVSHNRFYPYYNTMSERVSMTGYFVTDTKYFWESNLFDLTANKLVYSAQSTSFDPASAEELGHGYGQMIVKNMVKSQVLAEQRRAF